MHIHFFRRKNKIYGVLSNEKKMLIERSCYVFLGQKKFRHAKLLMFPMQKLIMTLRRLGGCAEKLLLLLSPILSLILLSCKSR